MTVARPPHRMIVVGAGVSGLAAAWDLEKRGHDVLVLEATDHVGGKTACVERNGFMLNTGAYGFLASYREIFGIVRELGLESELVEVEQTLGIVHDCKVYWLRGKGLGAVIDFVRTPLLSARSKLLLARLGVDAFRARKNTGYADAALRADLDTESVVAYCDRRLNAEIRDRLLAPLLGGIFLVDGAKMSVVDLHYALGSFFAGGLIGYRRGIDFLARALAKRLQVRTGARVTRVEPDGTGVRVEWEQEGSRCDEWADGVVLSVAAPLVPPLHPTLEPRLREVLTHGLQSADYVSVRFALVSRPENDAALVVVPADELGGLGTVMFEHNLSPDAVPKGKGIIGALFYDEWVRSRSGLSDDELIEHALSNVEHVVSGIADLVEHAEVTRWSPAVVRSVPGMHRLIAELVAATDDDRRIQLAGDYLSIPSTNGSIVSGQRAAGRLSAAVG